MDAFLVDPVTNQIVNCITCASLAFALEMYPELICHERAGNNAYLEIGDDYHD